MNQKEYLMKNCGTGVIKMNYTLESAQRNRDECAILQMRVCNNVDGFGLKPQSS